MIGDHDVAAPGLDILEAFQFDPHRRQPGDDAGPARCHLEIGETGKPGQAHQHRDQRGKHRDHDGQRDQHQPLPQRIQHHGVMTEAIPVIRPIVIDQFAFFHGLILA